VPEPVDSREPQSGPFERVRGAYRRRPVVAWVSTAVVVGIVAAVIVVVVSGGGDEPANVSIKCSVSDSDGSTALSLQGKVTQKESEEGCDQLAAKLSGPNSYWRVGLPPPPSTYPEIICGLNAPKGEQGTAIVEVNPESLGSDGTQICGSLAHEGWTQFTQGGVIGPWQAATGEAEEAEEEAAAAEEAIREEERQEAAEVEEEEIAESEAEESAVYACEERAEAKEHSELKTIERETEEAVAAAPTESKEYAIEEQGYEREEEAYEREFEAQEVCEETGGGGAE
jgi:flagellar biosynthesis GTPase FlhF